MTSGGAAEIIDLVKRGEPDRFVAGLFVPDEDRAGFYAVAGFHDELDRVLRSVREPVLAEIKLQWWRETLARFWPEGVPPGTDVLAKLSGHVVADKLAVLMNALPTPELQKRAIELLDKMIEVRSAQLSGQSVTIFAPSQLHLDWAAQAESLVFLLQSLILSHKFLPSFATTAQTAGAAYSLARNGQMVGVGENAEEIEGALLKFCTAFSELSPDIPSTACPAYLPLAVIPSYVKQTAKPSFLKQMPEGGPHRPAILQIARFWRIWRASRSYIGC